MSEVAQLKTERDNLRKQLDAVHTTMHKYPPNTDNYTRHESAERAIRYKIGVVDSKIERIIHGVSKFAFVASKTFSDPTLKKLEKELVNIRQNIEGSKKKPKKKSKSLDFLFHDALSRRDEVLYQAGIPLLL